VAGEPRFDLHIDDDALAEDLSHATEAARSAIERDVAGLLADGVPASSLRPCDAEARDGTRLGGCAKLYIPQPDGRWGAVFSIAMDDSNPVLLLLAVGERHPAQPWKLSVYEVAHRRLHW
jgi:hypothetical protein